MVIFNIALNTYRESSRNKIYLVFLGIGVAGILLTRALAYMSPEAENKMIIDFGIFSLAFFGTLMAIFNGAVLIHKDMEKRTIYTVLTKPISRMEFIIGKYLGLIYSIAFSIFILAFILTAYCYINKVPISTTFFWAIFFIFLQVCLISSVSVFFSMISSSLLCATFTLCFYVFGYALEGVKSFLPMIKNDMGKNIMEIVYALLPKMFYLDLKYEASHGIILSWSELGFLFVHASSYILLFVLLSGWLLDRKAL